MLQSHGLKGYCSGHRRYVVRHQHTRLPQPALSARLGVEVAILSGHSFAGLPDRGGGLGVFPPPLPISCPAACGATIQVRDVGRALSPLLAPSHAHRTGSSNIDTPWADPRHTLAHPGQRPHSLDLWHFLRITLTCAEDFVSKIAEVLAVGGLTFPVLCG